MGEEMGSFQENVGYYFCLFVEFNTAVCKKMSCGRNGHLVLAVNTFDAGLTKAHNDHLLHIRLRKLYAKLGNPMRSTKYMEQSRSKLYFFKFIPSGNLND